MEPENPQAPERPSRHGAKARSGGKRVITIVSVVVLFLLAYGVTLFAYWELSGSSTELGPADEGDGSETVVLVTVKALRTVDYQADVKVLVIPQDDLTDERLDVLNTDISVRLFPWNTLGDLNFPAGESPAEKATTLDLDGDVNNWPFDKYTSAPISATLLVGSGEDRQYVPARVEVEGALQGWDLYADEVPPGPNDTGSETATKLTLKRSLGPLAFDLGICIVLITLPTLAIVTALQVITRRKAFQMPFLTWYAAMLFAVVPLRNILPGAPPPGAWIDVALVLWVLVALVTAMVMAVVSWWKQVE
ncbi:DUF4436 domain-containing protein [Mycolicibacterium rhodesiae]|uniref:DUF4436 domain-containing protein n=1 Tax=Mycolicibacterium rhodesiae TaxID=36814 RepID=UPI0003165919|nr:DUF4436 domain-containing protein [Mycolicibacterium rhodesiae]